MTYRAKAWLAVLVFLVVVWGLLGYAAWSWLG